MENKLIQTKFLQFKSQFQVINQNVEESLNNQLFEEH